MFFTTCAVHHHNYKVTNIQACHTADVQARQNGHEQSYQLATSLSQRAYVLLSAVTARLVGHSGLSHDLSRP